MGGRILFLGTGGDSYVVGRQALASGGIVLNFENTQFHIDPGPGSLVMAKMMGLNLRETTAVIISKNDIYHANDVNAVISAMTHDGLDKRGVLICPTSLIEYQNSFLNKHYKDCLEKTITIDNTNKLAINNIEIGVVKLPDDFGYKFATERFTIGYITDTNYANDIAGYYEDCDILILCVKDPRSMETKGYLNSEGAEKIIKATQPQLAIITGFGTKMLQAESLYEAREIQKATGVQVIAAKDGMTINPVSFTTAVRQKKLKSY